MPGVGKLIKQAQKMQKRMESIQQELAGRVLEVSQGGGAVVVKINGQGELLDLQIDPEFLKEDAAMVQETILAAIRDAIGQARAVSEEAMGSATGGFSLPGLV